MTTPDAGDDAQAILQARARALARPAAAAPHADAIEVVTFAVAREQYAVESRHVVATFRVAAITPLPGARPPVVGLTAWRGDVLTLLDLRRLVGGSATGLDDLGHVIVLGGRHVLLGVLADVVHGLARLAPDALLPVPAARARAAHAPTLLRGITRDAMLLLDADALLARQSDTPDPSALPPE